MIYVVLARKYRPQNFEDVIFQEHVSRTLKNSLKNNRVGSGYLFCGPRGTGKTTVARIFAKSFNCEKGPTPEPCGKCSFCKEIAAGTSLDVIEIDAASNTGVDDVRTLRENIRYMPTGGKKRVVIIDEVHRLSGAAFDALLKTLEEPPAHVVFIFATTEPTKVPDTILSRTQKFDFKKVPEAGLAENLLKIASLEKIELSPEAAQLIARKAEGSVRDSLSLLDQIASFSGTKIGKAEVSEALGLADLQMIFDFVGAIADKDSKTGLELVNKIVESGTSVADFVSDLLQHFRKLILIVSGVTDQSLFDTTPEGFDKLKRQSDSFSKGDLIRLIITTGNLNADLKSGINDRLAFEVASVKMSQMESTVLLKDVLDNLGVDAAALQNDNTASAESSIPQKKKMTAREY